MGFGEWECKFHTAQVDEYLGLTDLIMTINHDDDERWANGLWVMMMSPSDLSSSTSKKTSLFKDSLRWLQHSHPVSLWIHSIIITTTCAPTPTSSSIRRFPSLPQLLLSSNTQLLFSINPTVFPSNLGPLPLLLLQLRQHQQLQHRLQNQPRRLSKNRLEQVGF